LEPGAIAPTEVTVAGDGRQLSVGGTALPLGSVTWAPPSTGLVYGVLLNDREDLERLASRWSGAPYKGLPKAPALYIKPYNTHAGHGATIRLPAGAARLALGATLGIVVGRPACRLSEQHALDAVRGYTIVNDLSVPHDSLFRPPIREKCFDGACPIGPWIVARDDFAQPDRALISIYVNGERLHRRTLDRLMRPVARLIADVTDFMTLLPGDVLLAGMPLDVPTAGAGDAIAVEIEGIGRLENRLAVENEEIAA
jgi:5-oxopent-3-ene-1,2,5-tricarboxylate decarboxylase/2-hydroxyhepta-2,4-diene-1,7-dioate isomerase